MKSEMLVFILVGGQGTRLGKLTQNIAKPAVQSGGCYRIIDFTLSNCASSGVDNVGIITQYQPLILSSHVGNGSNWGIDRISSGTTIPQPYSATEGDRWFGGASHAIYQDIDYTDPTGPEYVLILSGDHIYKMDYDDILRTHKDNLASLTVAVIDVPLKGVSCFGIMNIDSNDRIVEFEEKPEHPKSTKASMGIYIFNWQCLRKVLVDAEGNNADISDFGRNVIPTYLEVGDRVYTYNFDGYWKDVGTIESLWEANIEYIGEDSELHSHNRSWKVYSKNLIALPNFIIEEASVKNSLVVDGCFVSGKVDHSTPLTNAQVKKDVEITDSFVMSGATTGEGTRVKRAIVGENAVIGDGVEIDGIGKEVQAAGYNEVVEVPNED